MSAAILNRRVELINVGRVDDGAGGHTRADGVEATVWAKISKGPVSQQEHADRREQRTGWTIRIRWRPDFAATFGPEARARFTDGGGATREVSIQTVADPDDRRRYLDLTCTEGGPL